MTCGLATALEPPHFNHAPVRGAIGASFSRRSRAGSFNPRTRVGCDTAPNGRNSMTVRVSIHAPAWGATGGPAGPFHPRHGFNPRTRVGCDDLHLASQEQQACFNPRTRVGCDMPSRPPAGLSPRFNPRTRVGCDTSTASSRHHSREVSIHAPAWGATLTIMPFCLMYILFQSTHPRGVRLASYGFRYHPWCFNPRTRVGCDQAFDEMVSK